jgi:cytidylate kinase
MECHCREAEADARTRARKGKAPGRPFVTLSREAGAGGTTIALRLAEHLNRIAPVDPCPWVVFDKNLIDRVLEEHRLPQSAGEFMPEKKISEVRDILETMIDLHPPAFAMVRRISETILHLAQMGHVILIGRGANLLTRKLAGGVHVRIVGSQEQRLAHEQEFYRLSKEAALRKLKEDDKGRQDYIKQHFGKDPANPLHYDLVINTDRVPCDAAVEAIGRMVAAREAALAAGPAAARAGEK